MGKSSKKEKTKFNKGDKVVVLPGARIDLSKRYPDVYTVLSDNGDRVLTAEQGTFMTHWLEFEEIYNSPLYKAMNE